MKSISFSTLLLSSLVAARPSLTQRRSNVDAVNPNLFVSLNAISSCTSGNACIDGQLAQCVNGKYVLSPCGPGLACAALPFADSLGTSVTCTTQTDLKRRIATTGATNGTIPASTTVTPPTPTPTDSPCNSGSTNSSTAPGQDSLTLLPSVIASNFSRDGLNTTTSQAGEVASLTSDNNFINFCATLPNLPITNGRQLKHGSCNPAPIGAIPSTSKMPSTKFVRPVNLAIVPPKTTFQITLAVRNFAAGYFVNQETNFLSAPQQLDPTVGLIQGHAYVVIEALESLNQTTPTNPTKFAFFVALNSKADANGYLYANVTGGLPRGTYKMSTLLAAMNHQPVVLPIVERGVSDDAIYFTVADTEQGTNTTTITPTHTPQPSQPATTEPCY